MIIQDDNVVSKEEDCVEPSEDEDDEALLINEDMNVPAIAAALNNHTKDTREGSVARPRRTDEGEGVDRLHMCVEGKLYVSKREFNLATNGHVKIL